MKSKMINRHIVKIQDDSGAALIMSILFTLIINGLALTLFATTSREVMSSNSQVVYNDSFNTAEGAVNIGLLRIKALMEIHDPIDPENPFSSQPFLLAYEDAGDASLAINEYSFYDLVANEVVTSVGSEYYDVDLQEFTGSIAGHFQAQTSNTELSSDYLSGSTHAYGDMLDVGESTVLRGWRIFLQNNNDGDNKTALLVAIGYIIDPRNDVVYQKRIELDVYIHGRSGGEEPDPEGQVTSSETGARTGRYRVSTDLNEPVDSYNLR